MQGFVTERDFEQVEEAFPGICRFYRALIVKPRTFLELVWLYSGDENACKTERPPLRDDYWRDR
jgi:hypothetical protein